MVSASRDPNIRIQSQIGVVREIDRYCRRTRVKGSHNAIYRSVLSKRMAWQLFTFVAHQAIDWNTVGQPSSPIEETQLNHKSKST